MTDRFSRGDVERVARLARLELSGEEKDLFARQLAGILAYAEQIQRISTDGIEPTSHAGDAATLRDDEVRPSLPARRIARRGAGRGSRRGPLQIPRVLG